MFNMPTFRQLIKKGRKRKVHKSRVKALKGCPQVKGTCVKVYTTKPKKPHSAIRKIAKVSLSNGRSVLVCIPGHGHGLHPHSVVLVRGGRAPDVPGVRYKMIRGKHDFFMKEDIYRNKRRSKFGVRREKPSKL